MTRYETMEAIQTEKINEKESGMLPLDDEGRVVAEHKRESIDIPVNAVTIDPLR